CRCFVGNSHEVAGFMIRLPCSPAIYPLPTANARSALAGLLKQLTSPFSLCFSLFSRALLHLRTHFPTQLGAVHDYLLHDADGVAHGPIQTESRGQVPTDKA